MALSSSGSISLSQVQTEFGGVNPIHMGEYYQQYIQSNSSSTTIYPSVATTTTTYNLTTKLGTTAYERVTSGFNHTSFANTEIPALGSTRSFCNKTYRQRCSRERRKYTYLWSYTDESF